MNQLYIYICSYISTLLCLPHSHPPYPTPLGGQKHRADLPVLCDCFSLAIYFMFVSVYMYKAISHFVRAYPSPFPYPQVHSLVGLCLYSHLAPRFFRFFMTFFFFFPIFHIYVLTYGISFTLSDLLHSV